jgi:hypothetical protein
MVLANVCFQWCYASLFAQQVINAFVVHISVVGHTGAVARIIPITATSARQPIPQNQVGVNFTTT